MLRASEIVRKFEILVVYIWIYIYIFFFICLVEALKRLVSGTLDAVEFHECLIQAVSDFLVFLLLSHHFICKHSQCYFEENLQTLRYLLDSVASVRADLSSKKVVLSCWESLKSYEALVRQEVGFGADSICSSLDVLVKMNETHVSLTAACRPWSLNYSLWCWCNASCMKYEYMI